MGDHGRVLQFDGCVCEKIYLRTKIPESQRKRGTKVLVLSHTRGCWLQPPLLYIMSELTVFCGWKAASPPSPPRPPVMSTGRDFTLKRDSSGNEENVEFGWKIPNGFWVKWFLSFCLVGKVTSPTALLKLRGSPCWGHVRQPAATGAAEKPSRAWNMVHYQPRWTSWAIGCAVLADEMSSKHFAMVSIPTIFG